MERASRALGLGQGRRGLGKAVSEDFGLRQKRPASARENQSSGLGVNESRGDRGSGCVYY